MARYDPDSGLVYHETIVKQRLRPRTSWEKRCLGAKPSDHRSPRDADSLLNISLRKTVCHISTLKPETLRSLPAPIVDMIWKAVRRESRESFSVWKLFVQAGCGNQSTKHFMRYSATHEPLVESFVKMNCPKFLWMVDLELVDLHGSSADYKALSALYNLRTLTVRFRESAKAHRPFDDSVIAAMAHRANTEAAFPRLEMLFVENALDVTKESFPSLHRLPTLDLFSVRATGVQSKDKFMAYRHGWKVGTNSGFAQYASERASLNKLRARYNNREHFTYADLVKGYVQQQRSRDNCNIPHMSCLLGRHTQPSWITESRDYGLVFERDLKPQESLTTAERRKFTATLIGAASENDLPAKKRKLKDGKQIDMSRLLEGL